MRSDRVMVAAMIAVGGVGMAAAQDLPKASGAIRFASYNAALSADAPGEVVARLEGGGDAQARAVAEVVQRVRPDVLALQEIDRDGDGRTLAVFVGQYLGTSQSGAPPIDYPHTVFPPSNTGVPLGVDVDGDGRLERPDDARGFGRHSGQYAFALLSRLPLGPVRTFRTFLWRDVPGTRIPASYYAPAALAVMPLSSKTHLIAPIQADGGTIHVLAAHPTPPVFDDARDWNGRRNADEIRLLADLLDVRTSPWAMDDAGAAGGLPVGAHAVVMGDLNADPHRGDARPGAIARLLDDGRINAVAPRGAKGTATASFGGGLRVDYVLPTQGLDVTASGVYWLPDDDPRAALNDASDHHLVWVDVRLH
ncbi:endonuclease/exonuclease/phosphatase family protein [Acuticoccus sp.]|uniref:endonuclease/exonuclease/phosphatase family protein n=1 Tax=Acuticoccus sp. TaxID=1904378 RepID=UPI003B52B1B6